MELRHLAGTRSLRGGGETGILMLPLPDYDNAMVANGKPFEAIFSYMELPMTYIHVANQPVCIEALSGVLFKHL